MKRCLVPLNKRFVADAAVWVLLVLLVWFSSGQLAWGQAAPESAATGNPTEKPRRLPLPPEILSEKIDDYFGIYVDGSKVGWARGMARQSAAGDANARTLDHSVQLVVRFESFGKTIQTRSSIKESYALEPPHPLVEAREMTHQEGQTQALILRRVSGLDYELTIRSGNREERRPWHGLDHTLADSIAVEIWCRSPRKTGDKLTAQDLDLEQMRAEIEHFEVTAVVGTVVDGVPVTYYEILYHSIASNLRGALRYSDKGKMVSVDFSGQMELRLEPKDIAQNLDAPVDLFAKFLVPSGAPLGDTADIQSMTLEVVGENVALFESGPGLIVEKSSEQSGRVTLRTGTATDSPIPATAQEIKAALETTVRFPANDPKVITLARQAVSDAMSDREKVRRLVAFVSDFIEDDYASEPLDVHYIIEQKKGDCTEHTLLLATLARAAGIPCREITGLMYAGDDYQAFGGHAWNEVVIDGHWIPVDATWNQTEIDGAHIRIAHGRDFERGKLLNGKMTIKIYQINGNSLNTGK